MRVLLVLIVAFVFASCSRERVYDFNGRILESEAKPAVAVHLTLNEVTHVTNNGMKNYIVHFDYVLHNKSDSLVEFRFDRVKARLNGHSTSGVYFDSIIDVLPTWDTLRPTEERRYQLYAVFPDSVNLSSSQEWSSPLA